MILPRLTATRALIGVAALTATALAATAGGHGQNPAVAARQGQFQIMNLNISQLGGMARGTIEYDADLAQAAADNLVTISSLNQAFHWPPGTDNESIEGTRALPAIWEEGSRVIEIWGQFGEASTALAAVAGDGLDAMRAALGPVGATCGDCHESYRAEN